ncbi:MAG: DUF4118 domain-containing protein [Chloroflexi bacterium]|nr:DUF4118 domain-containing protein [Chloroflexota bacterium]
MLHRARTINPVAAAGMVGGIALVAGLIAIAEVVVSAPPLSILFLLPVMFTAVTWGWWYALGSSVLAFVAYDYLFVEPRHTFSIHDPEEWIALIVFMIVSALISNLAARERARREQASRQAWTATFLYELSRALGEAGVDAGLRTVSERLRSEFRLDGVVISRADPEGRLTPIVSVGKAGPALGSEPAGRVFAPPSSGARAGRWIVMRARGGSPGDQPSASRSARTPVANFPLRHESQQLGMLRLVGRPDGLADDETRLLATIADRLAVALGTELLRQEANRAEILRRADELRAALLNSVSHDLRTPLAAIKASAESLLQKDITWSEDDRDAFASAIDREADRLTRLVANLLDMSRIEGGALRPQRDWYDVGELVREVLARLHPVLHDRPVELTIAPGLAPVSLDYLMMDQVVTNLIENAVKYTPPGSPIILTVMPMAGGARLSVEDRGPGIPAARRERVFDKFFRLDTNSRVRGSGLGLAVSRGLVEGHGGRIWVEAGSGPEDQPGARFVVEIPSETAQPAAPQIASAEPASAEPASAESASAESASAESAPASVQEPPR